MRQYTTPTQNFLVRGIDLTGCEVHVTYSQLGYERDIIVQPEATEDGTMLNFTLSQEDTAAFKPGAVSIQINWKYPDGVRVATNKITDQVTPNLLNRVI